MKIPLPAHATSTATLALALSGLASLGCGASEEEADSSKAQAAVLANYAQMVSANYADTLARAKQLDTAVRTLTAEPSPQTLEVARKAWIGSREPYALSEAYRFYQGPIDNDDSSDNIPDGPEPLLNSWPLDESYIDYVLDGKGKVVDTGIINLPDDFPTIDPDVLAGANTAAGETSISTGYHAVEFLLWGQDLSADGPGDRPYTDFVTGPDATAENQDRRAQYLVTVTDMIVDELSAVNDAWLENARNYRADFLALPPAEALGKVLHGMGALAYAELSGERMQPAYDNQDQEDEHSCFSDNTLNDLHDNATSVQNVLLGHYGKISGKGVDTLIEAKDPARAQRLREQIQDAIDNIDAVTGPFDQAILGDDTENRRHLAAAIEALQDFGQTLVEAAQALDIDLKLGK